MYYRLKDLEAFLDASKKGDYPNPLETMKILTDYLAMLEEYTKTLRKINGLQNDIESKIDTLLDAMEGKGDRSSVG